MKYLDVTCGSLFGRLHKDKFFCPGIHQECIEHEGRFVSPKAFSVMGDKVKLKDWKNAIRVNGILLRKYIDAALLDFHKHKDNCTGRCVARSPSRPLGTFCELALSAQPQHPLALVTSVGTINEHTYCHLPDDSEPDLIPAIIAAEEKSKAEEQEEFTKLRPAVGSHTVLSAESPSGSNHCEDGYDRLNPAVSGVQVKVEQQVVPVTLVRAVQVKREVPSPSPLDINGAMDDEEADEDTLFWRGIVQLGLVDEFFRDIKTYLDVLKHDMVKQGVVKRDANKLSSIVNELGLMTKLKFRMSQHKLVMQSQQDRLDIEMEEPNVVVLANPMRRHPLAAKRLKGKHFASSKEPRNRCAVCASEKRENGKYKDTKTVNYCDKCKKYLCKKECFERYHTLSSPQRHE